jgi:hypothetical protein
MDFGGAAGWVSQPGSRDAAATAPDDFRNARRLIRRMLAYLR